VPRQLAEQVHDVLADEGFPACQTQLANSLVDEGSAETLKLLEGQQVLLRQECHVFRHAIGAAEVAAVRHGHAQVRNLSTERVDHRH
jgi:hypothetical protein